MTYETRERIAVGASSGTAFGGPLDSQHCSDLLVDTTTIHGPGWERWCCLISKACGGFSPMYSQLKTQNSMAV